MTPWFGHEHVDSCLRDDANTAEKIPREREVRQSVGILRLEKIVQ